MQPKNISDLVFSNSLRRLMSSRNVTQEALASAVGVSQGAVSGWMRGAVPKSTVIMKLAKFFNLDIAELMTGKHSATFTSAVRPDEVSSLAEAPAEYLAGPSIPASNVLRLLSDHELANIGGQITEPTNENLQLLKAIIAEYDRRKLLAESKKK